VITDSGGVQEETSALRVRCFTLRDTTERPVTVELGTNTVLGVDPDGLYAIPKMLAEAGRPAREIALWDGRAGERAAAVLTEFLASLKAHGPKQSTAGSGRKSTSDAA
jgi:UDP-N-acetylglucosamine 2-epimerase (non-hydrolysing)